MKMHDSVTSLSAWLTHPGSFMERLKQHGVQDAEVRVWAEGFQAPLEDEHKMLGIEADSSTWVREVVIASGDRVWMVARTVIPRATLTGPEQALQHLNNRSLGSFLFKDPNLTRSEFDIQPVLPNSFWYQKIAAIVPLRTETLFSRRSVFCTNGKKLLLTEVFFPTVGELS